MNNDKDSAYNAMLSDIKIEERANSAIVAGYINVISV